MICWPSCSRSDHAPETSQVQRSPAAPASSSVGRGPTRRVGHAYRPLRDSMGSTRAARQAGTRLAPGRPRRSPQAPRTRRRADRVARHHTAATRGGGSRRGWPRSLQRSPSPPAAPRGRGSSGARRRRLHRARSGCRFGRALGNQVAHHAEDTHRRQPQRERREAGEDASITSRRCATEAATTSSSVLTSAAAN